MRKLLTAFSSESKLKGCRVRLCPGRDGSARGRASALWRAGLCACPETGAVTKGARDGGRTPCDDGALAAGPGAAGTRRFRAAYLTVWGVPARRTDRMDVHMQMAKAVRQTCIATALQAYDDAGVSGLCHEERWAYAVDAMRRRPVRPLVHTRLLTAADEEGGGLLASEASAVTGLGARRGSGDTPPGSSSDVRACLAHWFAVCRRSPLVDMGMRRPRTGAPLSTRWARPWRGEGPPRGPC
jgi:hypothetical protein